MASDLSKHSQRTFQVVSLLATVMVVGIHYKTDVPNTPSVFDATWNELLQEYWLGGIARVAVPMFAFTAGLFYFRSSDGTLACYRKKFAQRCRTVLFPYFIIASIAMTSWLLMHRLRSEPVDMGLADLLSTWLLRPPAEQLWFLRDLIVLVAIAPAISWATKSGRAQSITIAVFGAAWMLNWQPFPIVAQWHLIQVETLLFFTIGCIAAARLETVNRLTEWKWPACFALCLTWGILVAIRVALRADFDIWYLSDYGLPNLIVHQLSILVGCVALFTLSARVDSPRLQRLSGASFFVFLVHEFPLRAVVEKAVEKFGDVSLSCWYVFPAVVIGCYASAIWTSKQFPVMFATLTGGRTPTRAEKLVCASRFTTPAERPTEQVTS